MSILSLYVIFMFLTRLTLSNILKKYLQKFDHTLKYTCYSGNDG